MSGTDWQGAAVDSRALNRVILFLAAIILSMGSLCRGFDSVAGMGLSYLFNIILMIALMFLSPPSRMAVRRMQVGLCLSCIAILWAALATWIGNDSWTEFATPRLLSVGSGLAALLCGCLLGLSCTRRGIGCLLDMMLSINCALLLLGLALFNSDSTGGNFDYWTVSRLGRFTGTIGNSNVTAALAGAFCVYAIWKFVQSSASPQTTRGRTTNILHRLLYGFAVLLTLGVLVATASRSNLVMILVILGLLAVSRLRYLAALVTRRTLPAFATLLAIALGSTIFGVFQTGHLSERFDRLSSGFDLRMTMWNHYLAISGQSPWLGYGLGSFQSVNAHFLSSPHFAEMTSNVNSPHSLPLQLLLVGGWPYLALLALAAAVISLQIWQSIRTRWTGDHWMIAAMVGVIASAAMVDISLDMPVTVTLAMLLAGLLWGQSLKSDVAFARLDP